MPIKNKFNQIKGNIGAPSPEVEKSLHVITARENGEVVVGDDGHIDFFVATKHSTSPNDFSLRLFGFGFFIGYDFNQNILRFDTQEVFWNIIKFGETEECAVVIHDGLVIKCWEMDPTNFAYPIKLSIYQPDFTPPKQKWKFVRVETFDPL